MWQRLRIVLILLVVFPLHAGSQMPPVDPPVPLGQLIQTVQDRQDSPIGDQLHGGVGSVAGAPSAG